MLNKKLFLKELDKFITVFRIENVTEKTIESWYGVLQKYTKDDQFTDAIENLCETLKDFYPSSNFVALVNEKIKDLYPRDDVVNAYDIPGLMDDHQNNKQEEECYDK